MKRKISMRLLKDYKHIYAAGYGELQSIFAYEDAPYYNAGIYGWNCDIYFWWVSGEMCVITTGYRNTKGKRIPAEIIEKYSREADDIRHGRWMDIADTHELMKDNIGEFLQEVIAKTE